MTQIAEGVMVGMFEELTLAEEKCKVTSTPPKWEARINKGIGTNSDCDAQRLYESMKSKKDDRGFRAGKEPFVEKVGGGHQWELDECNSQRFPLQAHHIIPKNFLPTHVVCSFLAKKYNDNPLVKLKGDTPYDTDHAYNGYCLPYATPLKEWGKAKDPSKKDEVAKALMKQTDRQLHQGSHKQYQYTLEAPVAEEEEDDEVGHQEGPGYLGKVEALLDVISVSALDHVSVCRVCKPSEDARETNPRERVVCHVDQVSGIVKILMDANRIFVSERAFRAFQANKVDPELPDWLSKKKK